MTSNSQNTFFIFYIGDVYKYYIRVHFFFYSMSINVLSLLMVIGNVRKTLNLSFIYLSTFLM